MVQVDLDTTSEGSISQRTIAEMLKAITAIMTAWD
jgi:hypothetical protein